MTPGRSSSLSPDLSSLGLSAPDQAPASLTEDAFFDGALMIRQPAGGFRAGMDSVLLAAAAAPGPGDQVVDAGCGAGTVALCLAWRCPEVRLHGIERLLDMARLAAENAWRNGLQARVAISAGDLFLGDGARATGMADQVVTNPPYGPAGHGRRAPDAAKAAATSFTAGQDITGWLAACLALLRPGGLLTLVYRADSLAPVLTSLHSKAGDIRICPLWPKAGLPARRVLVRARKGARASDILCPGVVLHGPEGEVAPAVRAVLRDGAPLDAFGDSLGLGGRPQS